MRNKVYGMTAAFADEPETFHLKINGEIIGLIAVEKKWLHALSSMTILPNILNVEKFNVKEILDFRLVPTLDYVNAISKQKKQ